MTCILIVEDEPALLRGLADNFRRERYEVLTAADGELGYRLATERRPDLVVLDVMLPKMSGFEVCRRLRAEGFAAPILLLTARSEESDRVFGLDLGADDYVTKPFSIRELLARVRAHLRRTGKPEEHRIDRLEFDVFKIDFHAYEAQRDGAPLEMTRREFQLLRELASQPGRVFSRDELLEQVWGADTSITNRTIDNHVASLRAKLESNPEDPQRLITVRGVGYKWSA
jgi:DNA-binding response OmpR family regulator